MDKYFPRTGTDDQEILLNLDTHTYSLGVEWGRLRVIVADRAVK